MVSINRRFEIYTGPSHIADPRATAPSSLYNVPNVSFETNFLFDISILRAETRFFFFFFLFLFLNWLKGWPTFAFSSRNTWTFGRFGGIIENHFRSQSKDNRLSSIVSRREPSVTDHSREWPKALEDRAARPKIPENNRNTIGSPFHSYRERNTEILIFTHLE